MSFSSLMRLTALLTLAGCSSQTTSVLVTIDGFEPLLTSLTAHATLDSPLRSGDVRLPTSLPVSFPIVVPNAAATLTVTVKAADLTGNTQTLTMSKQTVPATQQRLDFHLDVGSGDGGAPRVALVQALSVPSAMSATRTQMIHETSGNLLVAAVYWHEPAATISVFDSQSNCWMPLPPQINNACKSDVQLFYADDIAGGDNVVTVKQSTGSNYVGFFLLELSGIALAGALDGTVGKIAPAAGSHTIDLGALTTHGARDAVVALFHDSQGSGTLTPGAGLSSEGLDVGAYSMVADAPGGVTPGSHPIAATLPVDDAGLRSDNCWVATAAAFRSP